MKTDHQDGTGRGKQAGSETNVVRLPTDWLGPREELVPIGRRARELAAEEHVDHASPPSAEDFWGEGASAVHHAVQPPPPPASAGGQLLRRPPARLPRLARRKRPRRPTTRRGSLVAGAVLVGVATVAAIAIAEATGVGNRTISQHRGVHTTASVPLTGTTMPRPSLSSRPSHDRSADTRDRSAPRVRHRRPVISHRTQPVVHHDAASRASVTAVAPVTTSPVTVSPTVTTESGVTPTVPSPSRPAFGDRGTLGPGHSPSG